MAKNQVTLTFAGDSTKLEKSFDNVGGAAERMDRRVRDSADGFDRAAQGFDTADTRAMGFRDTITGVTDSYRGLTDESKSLEERLLLVGMGVGDLASGFANLIVPMAKTAATFVAQKVAMVAHAVATTAVSAATKIWTGVQWLLNAALIANPIGLIIVAIIALIAIIVLIATKTTWFQTIWRVAWGAIKAAALAVWNWISGTLWPGIRRVVEGIANVFRTLPGRIRTAFSGLVSIISAPFRAAFNLVSRAWNSTIGRLSWSVPGWVPVIGGNSISAPRLPTFHRGGTVPGAPGTEMLAVLQAGETVTPLGGGGGTTSIVVSGGGTGTDRMVAELVLNLIRKGAIRLEVRNNRVAVA